MSGSSHQKKPSLGLVDYSDSDSDSVGLELEEAKAKDADSLPPLPSKFHDLYAASPRLTTADDPAVHGGRHRSIPHVEGNWPTHIYFEWHLNSADAAIVGRFLETGRNAVEKHRNFHRNEAPFKLESFLHSDLGTQLPLHISMSRPVVLRTEEREQFMTLLEKRISHLSVEPFEVHFTSLEWVPNQDRTRWFWVMRATSPVQSGQRQQSLSTILATCNEVTNRHNQPGLYLAGGRGAARDGFHVSIGWSLREPTDQLREDISASVAGNQAELSSLTMGCDALKAKIGNVVHAIELRRGF